MLCRVLEEDERRCLITDRLGGGALEAELTEEEVRGNRSASGRRRWCSKKGCPTQERVKKKQVRKSKNLFKLHIQRSRM